MPDKKNSRPTMKANSDVASRLIQFQSPEATEALKKFHKRFARYALPSAEARKVIDAAMGSKTLSEELRAMREE